MHEVTTNYVIDAESDYAVPFKCEAGLINVLRMHCTTEVYVFIM